MSRSWWLALQVTKRLWFRATLYAVIAVATAALGILIGPFIPDSFSDMVGAQAVDSILSIIASSMLAVTTFSLSTLVSATTAAATSGTPRAISLLLQDRTAQSALSTFLGAFLFSLVGLIALNTGLYGGGGRLVLFIVTLAVVALIVTMLLRWIDHLAGLGQVGETIRRVTDTTEDALTALCERPYLGGVALETVPDNAEPLYSTDTGYLRHLDMSRLSEMALWLEATIHVVRRPGDFCSPAEPLLYMRAPQGFGENEEDAEDTRRSLRLAFTIGDSRSFDQDPLFGLTVLSEIASRALSPGINDPGTAVDVITQATQLLAKFEQRRDLKRESVREAEEAEADHPQIHVKPVSVTALVEAAYLAISRDGAGMIEVTTALQRALGALSASRGEDMAAAAAAMGKAALVRGLETLVFEDDRQRLRNFGPKA